MQPFATDLFGEVAVTWPEVWEWLEAVPRMRADSPRAAAYIRGYDVPGKIARARADGTIEGLLATYDPPAYWWHRFNWR